MARAVVCLSRMCVRLFICATLVLTGQYLNHELRPGGERAKMRNWMLVLAIFIVSVTFGAKNSSAQTDLTLQLTNTGALPILFRTSGISISQSATLSNSWSETVVSGVTKTPNLQPLRDHGELRRKRLDSFSPRTKRNVAIWHRSVGGWRNSPPTAGAGLVLVAVLALGGTDSTSVLAPLWCTRSAAPVVRFSDAQLSSNHGLRMART